MMFGFYGSGMEKILMFLNNILNSVVGEDFLYPLRKSMDYRINQVKEFSLVAYNLTCLILCDHIDLRKILLLIIINY